MEEYDGDDDADDVSIAKPYVHNGPTIDSARSVYLSGEYNYVFRAGAW